MKQNLKQVLWLFSICVFIIILALVIFHFNNAKNEVENQDMSNRVLTDDEIAEIFRKHAPNYDPIPAPGIDAEKYSSRAAFLSCMRNKDVENSFFWVNEYWGVDEITHYYRGLVYEMAGEYEKSISEYDLYCNSVAKRPPSEYDTYFDSFSKCPQRIYARPLFYLNKKSESAKYYVALVLEHKSYADEAPSFYRLRDRYEIIDRKVICNPYYISEPFENIDELIIFLEREANNNQDDKLLFDDAISYLKYLSDHKNKGTLGEPSNSFYITHDRFENLRKEYAQKNNILPENTASNAQTD